MKKLTVIIFSLIASYSFIFGLNVYAQVSTISTTPNSPTASILANGKSDLTVNIGDRVVYTWSSTNAVSANPIYISVIPPAPADININCHNNKLFISGGLNGSSSPTAIDSDLAGCNYEIVYTVTGSNGVTASSIAKIHINPIPSRQTTLTALTNNTCGGYIFLRWPDPYHNPTDGTIFRDEAGNVRFYYSIHRTPATGATSADPTVKLPPQYKNTYLDVVPPGKTYHYAVYTYLYIPPYDVFGRYQSFTGWNLYSVVPFTGFAVSSSACTYPTKPVTATSSATAASTTTITKPPVTATSSATAASTTTITKPPVTSCPATDYFCVKTSDVCGGRINMTFIKTPAYDLGIRLYKTPSKGGALTSIELPYGTTQYTDTVPAGQSYTYWYYRKYSTGLSAVSNVLYAESSPSCVATTTISTTAKPNISNPETRQNNSGFVASIIEVFNQMIETWKNLGK